MINFYPLLSTIENKEQRIMAESMFASNKYAMYHIAYNILKNEADAEDAVMKAAENICRHIRDFSSLDEQGRKLKISLIVKNAAIDIYRSRHRHRISPYDDLLFSDEDYSFASEDVFLTETDGTHNFGSVEKCVAALREKYRIILLMKYGEQRSNREIGQILHIPESTVATRLARAKVELKKKLDEAGKHL